MAQRDHSNRQSGGFADDPGFGQRSGQQHGGQSGGHRSDAGSNYGDFRRDQHQQFSDRGRQAGDYPTGHRGLGQQGGFDGPSGYGGQQGGYGMSDFPTSQDFRGPEGDAAGYGRYATHRQERWPAPDWRQRQDFGVSAERYQDVSGGRDAWRWNQAQERDFRYDSHQHHSQREQFDPDYHQWRAEQLRTLDNDYRQWRDERYKKFSEDFDTWRKGRSAQATTVNELPLGKDVPGGTTGVTEGLSTPKTK